MICTPPVKTKQDQLFSQGQSETRALLSSASDASHVADGKNNYATPRNPFARSGKCTRVYASSLVFFAHA